MTSYHGRDAHGSFANRRGHSSQLSISDPSHHVTEAIGTLYGDEDDDTSRDQQINHRPLSFMPGSSQQEQIHRSPLRHEPQHDDSRRQLTRAHTDQTYALPPEQRAERRAQTLPIRSSSQRAVDPSGYGTSRTTQGSSPTSPAPSLRDIQEPPGTLPLTNIENPNDIAQELSNLQALRRMSMDVGNNIDPDLPHMSLPAMPSIAPSGDDDENDPSRLLWVPAKVHPELAPAEFKSFLEKRVNSIKRRSGESMLSPDGLGRSNSALNRRKSTLSRQIDSASAQGGDSYTDGAERLEGRRARGHQTELSLDELVKDPTTAVQKFAQESTQSTGADNESEDMPILPMAPGTGLRRSTRTTYRKGGSLRSGGASRRQANSPPDAAAASSHSTRQSNMNVEAPKGFGLSRVQSEPIAENYSRPTRPVRPDYRQANQPSQDWSARGYPTDSQQTKPDATSPEIRQDQISVRPSQSGTLGSSASQSQQLDYADNRETGQLPPQYPTRSSSQYTRDSELQEEAEQMSEPPPRSSRRNVAPPLPSNVTSTTTTNTTTSNNQPSSSRSQSQRQAQYTAKSASSQSPGSLNDTLTANPSALPGGGATSTDSLTFIPTMAADEKKSDKKSRRDRDDDAGSISSSKSSSAWKWFKGGSNEDKKKEDSRKSKNKYQAEKAQDNARLDVIQNSIDKSSPKGRESLVLERDHADARLQEERKKDSNRRSDSRRDKDGSIFSSIFGSKRKEDRDRTTKKNQQHLQVPEEPVYKALVPDIDFHWTRFPLLEERAIYRMAHIKLANPRRPLLSQVLLSNFMYSYLAIVQAMHPQMNVPTSPHQKRLDEEARRKQQDEEQSVDDDGNGLDQYDFDYHRATIQYAEQGASEQIDYVDDAQIYEDEHWSEHQEEYNYDGSDGYGHDSKGYYQQYDDSSDRRHDGQGDLW